MSVTLLSRHMHTMPRSRSGRCRPAWDLVAAISLISWTAYTFCGPQLPVVVKKVQRARSTTAQRPTSYNHRQAPDMKVLLLLASLAMQSLSTRASSVDSGFPLGVRKLSHQHSHPYNAGFTDVPKSMQCPGYSPPPTVKKTCAPFSFNITCTSTSTSDSALTPTSRSAEEDKMDKERQDDCSAQLPQILQRITTDESTWNCLTLRAASSSALSPVPLSARQSEEGKEDPAETNQADAHQSHKAKGSTKETKSTILLPSVDVRCHMENWLPIWLNNTAWNATGAMPSATGGLVGGEWAFGTRLETCIE
ncbi:hypothetical protein BCV69DRAFT_153078 [Microstroma glucosiphilum]|uniref:Uncharacterized protein n=1 Tax=Pseudomicrostroma glucosiphilum TaxID=1684307 RepID=A0A316U971_9BASI|nr:hypothetical protein BCV69DRAFT_153078 [Pseudomicrostroma glucosiphilum]PWN21722.1 hypothetical protein BCV69DRAFT_153078 [Pseudomicrostroma glucosiphilum]